MVTIANTGQISATFLLLSALQNQEKMPVSYQNGSNFVSSQTLSIHLTRPKRKGAYKVTLAPGDTTGLELVIDITDGELVHELNWGISDLEDVLVLRVENGRDHFIPVKERGYNLLSFADSTG